jgi:sialate O-acetylesterase
MGYRRDQNRGIGMIMIRWIKQICAWTLLVSAMTNTAWASIELPWLLSDGAVLQRDEPVPIWGTATAGSEVTIDFAGHTQKVLADSDGKWSVKFPAKGASGPHTIRVSGKEFSRAVTDIWMGDVWVCSGQSNMEWILRNSQGADAEIQAAPFKQIRHFKIPTSWSANPSDTLTGGQWRTATPEYLGEFTGAGWYFAKRIYATTEVPIGLINATWGGSKIEAWMSPAALGKTSEETQSALMQLTTIGEARAGSVKKNLLRWPGSVVKQVTEAKADWSAANMDEADWLRIQVPGLWEEQEYAGVDGVIWYRRAFELNKSQAAAGLTLGLGLIDDKDITWVNGYKVGETHTHDRVRTYTVPAEFLKEGKNQIAIRIEDTGGGGGIYSNSELVYWRVGDGPSNSLAGEWSIKADRISVSVRDNIHHTETALYNQMLHPLFRIPIKGVLWYQGESNAGTMEQAQEYRKQFPAFITDLRQSWNKPHLPFYWVQLANFISKRDSSDSSPWATLRESQTAALALNNTGQAITIDVGNPLDIHPTDKKTVGERLARIALNNLYGYENVLYRGPVFHSAKLKHNQLIVKFSKDKKLTARENGALVKGFEIAGVDGQFQKVDGAIKSNRVVLPLNKSMQPKMLRYAWSDNPVEANLVDLEGLPAEPFRIDF